MIYYAVTDRKRVIPDDYLALQAKELVDRMRVVTYDAIAESDGIPRGTWILSDLDGLGPAGKELARELADKVAAADLPLLNHPDRTLERFPLIERLHAVGINGYRAVRATSDDISDLTFPVFVRGASDHLGPLGGLLHDVDEVRDAVRARSDAGLDVDDLIAVEFEDTREEDGLYTKYGAYRVGERIVPQHLLRADTWMIKHSGSIFTPEIAREEQRYLEENPHEAQLREMFDAAGVDFGRADYAVAADGRIRVWEINLCPMFARGRRSFEKSRRRYSIPEDVRKIWERSRPVRDQMLIDAIAATNSERPSDPPIPRTPSPELGERIRAEVPRNAGGSGLMTLLRAKTHFGNRW